MPQPPTDFAWAVPVMRLGYAGRGLVYLVLAGFSLFAIWQGGQAKGTGSVLKSLETSIGGQVVLVLIAFGMAAYAVWRLVDALWDLEDYGTDSKGLMARCAMLVTGVLHAGLGIAALAVLLLQTGSGGSTIAEWTGRVMALPAGRVIVGAGGVATMGAGFYYVYKAMSEAYRDQLQSNPITRRWNLVLKLGVLAQALMVTVIGGFLAYAALTANPGQAGGSAKVFEFLSTQPFGQFLVLATCLGLLGFAVFCFVTAVYKIVPKVNGGDVKSLTDWAKAKARA